MTSANVHDHPVMPLLPATTRVDQQGRISIGGVPLASIAEEHGTPVYVFDVATFRSQAKRFVDGLAQRWPTSEVLFASKSLPALALYKLAAGERLSIDVAGEGELRMALAAGVDPATIYMHGNAKTHTELALALASRVGTIVVDNADELEVLEELATSPQGVMVRVIPTVTPDTHPSQATGGRRSKFGVPIDQAVELVKRVAASDVLALKGVHLHIGSQVLHVRPFEDAIRRIAAIGTQEAYNIGGGLGVPYTRDDVAPTVEAYLDGITRVARSVLPSTARLVIEPGRSLIACAGVTVYSVVNVKQTGRSFIAVNGGMADQLDVALTSQRYEAVIDGRLGTPVNGCYTVVGRHCESGDTLIDDIELPRPSPGELMVMPVTGAYSYTLANNYNGAYIPPIVFVEDGRTWLASRRQTFEDVLKLHVVKT